MYVSSSNPFPNTFEAVKSISSKEFEFQYDRNFKYGILQVNNQLEHSINDMPFAHHLQNATNKTFIERYIYSLYSVLIAFESIVGSREYKIFWKTPNDDNIYLLNLNDNKDGLPISFLVDFIIGGVNRSRIISRKIKMTASITVHQISICNLIDSYQRDLLMYAVINNWPNYVQKLLKFPFNLDEIDYYEWDAITYAWKANRKANGNDEKRKLILLELLNADSKYPSKKNGFRSDAPETPEIKQRLEEADELRKFLREKDLGKLEEKIKNKPNLHYYYNDENESLFAYALKIKNPDAINLLIRHGIKIGNHEDLNGLLKQLDDTIRKVLRLEIRTCAIRHTDAHIASLISKSSIGNNDLNVQEHMPLIVDAYNILNEHSTCKKILKLIALNDKLKIYFDFTQESVMYLDPMSGIQTTGTIYDSMYIYIGAKHLKDAEKKYKCIGVIIHEFCHCAILLTYANKFDPFPMGDSVTKIIYNKIFQEIKNRYDDKEKFDEIFRLAFECYDANSQPSELIVRPIHIIMHYLENQTKINEICGKFINLFKCFENTVIHEIESATKIYEKLQNNEDKLSFNDLTDALKANVMHTEIEFQGKETSFYEIFDKQEEIAKQLLSELPSKIIRQMLKNKMISVLYELDEGPTRFVLPRKLRQIKTEDMTKKSSKYEGKFKGHAKSSEVFILSEEAGSGKSVMFEKLALLMNNRHSSFWIMLIKCVHSRSILETYKNKLECLNVTDILKSLFDIEDNFEVALLDQLYMAGKLILMFDGVDELCPDLKELIFKILVQIREKTSNQIWISTRPHLAEELKFSLQGKLLEFVRLNRKKIISNAFEIFNNNPTNKELTDLLSFLKIVDRVDNKIQNTSMLKSLTTIYGTGEQNFSSQYCNIYVIFEELVKMQIERVSEKIQPKDITFKAKFKKDDLCAVYALKQILGTNDELTIEINNLSIVKNWLQEQKPKTIKGTVTNSPWTVDVIQRNGLLTFKVECPKTEGEKIKYIHVSYGEYFLIKFIADHLFGIFHGTSDDDYNAIFNIIRLIGKSLNYFEVVRKFLIGHIATDKDDEDKKIHIAMKKIIENNIENIKQDIIDSGNYFNLLELWCAILDNDLDVLKNFWAIEQEDLDENYFMTILRHKTQNFQYFVKLFNTFIPQLLKLHGSQSNVSTNPEIPHDSFKDSQHESFNKNWLDFINVAEIYFTIDDITFIRNNYIIKQKIAGMILPQVRNKCIEKFPIFNENVLT